MKTLAEIKCILDEHRDRHQKELGLKSMAVFGSYSRNEQTKESDLDILIDFKRPIGLLRFIALERHLSDLLGVKVELVTKRSLKPSVERIITHDRIPV